MKIKGFRIEADTRDEDEEDHADPKPWLRRSDLYVVCGVVYATAQLAVEAGTKILRDEVLPRIVAGPLPDSRGGGKRLDDAVQALQARIDPERRVKGRIDPWLDYTTERRVLADQVTVSYDETWGTLKLDVPSEVRAEATWTESESVTVDGETFWRKKKMHEQLIDWSPAVWHDGRPFLLGAQLRIAACEVELVGFDDLDLTAA